MKRMVALLTSAVIAANLAAGTVSVQAGNANRLVDANLVAYYDFEDAGQLGRDASGNGNDLVTPSGWGDAVERQDGQSGDLALGKAGYFNGNAVLIPRGAQQNTADFLDAQGPYTISMFFKNDRAGSGGTLFNNKNWGNEGVKLLANKWADTAASGQVELYFDYSYKDGAGLQQNYHNVVKFMPAADGGMDESWHNLTFTVDTAAKQLKVYYDGQLTDVNTPAGITELMTACAKYSFALGGAWDDEWNNAQNAYQGWIDEVRIYNFVADAHEVQALAVNRLTTETQDRLTDANLAAYYDFEDAGQIGKDASGNNRHLLGTVWGYAPAQTDSQSGELQLGKCVDFDAGDGQRGVLTVAGAAYDQKDFLDDMDAYTLSLFFQNSETCEGGILFNNKFWGEDGIRVLVNKWGDPSATGQAELYLDYQYTDTQGQSQSYHGCVKFMPAAQGGGVNQSWHNLVLAVDKPNHRIRFYYDGELVHENADAQSMEVDSKKYPLAFGAMLDPQWPSAEQPYDGMMDEIRIYSFAADADEAGRLARNQITGAAEDWQIGTTPVLDRYDPYTYTLPFWQGDTVYQESVLVLKNKDGSVPKKALLYPATEILSVRSQDLKTVYTEGSDYVLQDGKLTFPSGSTIPMMEQSEYYPSEWTEGSTYHTASGGLIWYSEAFQKRQIAVTYRHDGTWSGQIPSYQGRYLPKTMERLTHQESLNIVLYGDSITEGYSTSGFIGFEPFAETWPQMLAKLLRATYEYGDISIHNAAVAGTDTAWGVDDGNLTPRVIEQNPDLVVIAFGMNDSNRSLEDYRNKIEGMITKVRAARPDTEFLLVSPMLPNTEVDWLSTGNQALYQEALLAIQSRLSGVAVARVTDAFRSLIDKKDYCDVTGNNVNHPNDFSARMYAQVILQALCGSIDTSVLSDLIHEAESLDEELYTEGTWDSLMATIERVKGALSSPEQAVVDQGAAELRQALEALVFRQSRLEIDRLIGYYDFEYAKDLGYDLSSKKNHLLSDFWGDEVTAAPSGGGREGSCAFFNGSSVMIPRVHALNQPDYLDLSDAFTLSFYFKMNPQGNGGTLFSNKNWADEGIKITAHVWEHPTEAVGQVEIFLDYSYRNADNRIRNFHEVVYFMPEAAGGGIDDSWHHIVLSVDNETNRLAFYFDGQKKAVTPADGLRALNATCDTYTLAFGGCFDDEWANAQAVFTGWLDDIRVYDFAATAKEADLLYKAVDLPTPDPKTDEDIEETHMLHLEAQSASGMAVSFSIPRAALPAGVTLKAADSLSGADYEAVKRVLGSAMRDAACLNVTLLDGDTPITELPDYGNLRFGGRSDWDGHILYRLNPDGTLERLDAFVNGRNELETYSQLLGTFVFFRINGGGTGNEGDDGGTTTAPSGSTDDTGDGGSATAAPSSAGTENGGNGEEPAAPVTGDRAAVWWFVTAAAALAAAVGLALSRTKRKACRDRHTGER